MLFDPLTGCSDLFCGGSWNCNRLFISMGGTVSEESLATFCLRLINQRGGLFLLLLIPGSASDSLSWGEAVSSDLSLELDMPELFPCLWAYVLLRMGLPEGLVFGIFQSRLAFCNCLL